MNSNTVFRKIAFIGVNKHWYKMFSTIKGKGIVITFFADYGKAKEWLLG